MAGFLSHIQVPYLLGFGRDFSPLFQAFTRLRHLYPVPILQVDTWHGASQIPAGCGEQVPQP